MFSRNMASTTTRMALALASISILGVACEHKSNKSSRQGDTGSDRSGKPDPAVATGDVRAPVAADLAEYTKALPGTGDKLLATIETPLGTLHCELYPDKAPITVANFVGLAIGKKPWRNPRTGAVESGKPYFDGLEFHRVIPGFMIQGGDPTGTGTSGPGYSFEDELSPSLDMGPGTLAMANAGPKTNGSQFFVMEGTATPLARKHSIFGACKEIEVVSKITNTPRGGDDHPNEPVKMKVTISKG